LEKVKGLGEVLLVKGDKVLLKMREEHLSEIKNLGGEVVKITRVPLPWKQRAKGKAFSKDFVSDPFIQQLVDSVSQDSITSYIQRLENFQTRYFFSDSLDKAADYLYGKLSSFGLDSVAYDSFYYNSRLGRNVVGTLRGTLYPDRIYIICGHYDSYSYDHEHAPGADDNASGTAAVLEAARIFSLYSFDATIKFICFSAEEMGLIGSKHYAENAYNQGLDIRGVLNFDMIAYQDDSYLDVYIFTDEKSQPLADLSAALAGIYTNLDEADNNAGNSWGSDHWYFQQYGYPAIFSIEKDRTHWNPYYHTPGDLLSTISIPFAKEVVKMGVATLGTLGLYPKNPKGLVVRTVPSGGELDLSWTPNDEHDLAGYKVYYGLASGDYGPPINVGNTIHYVLSGLTNELTYYIAITAYDSDLHESGFSREETGIPAHTSLDQGILIVDETFDGNGSRGSPTDAQQDTFYTHILRGYPTTNWDCAIQGLPNIFNLGFYSTILWHADDYTQQNIYSDEYTLSMYLDAGGQLWLVGWRPIWGLMNRSGSYPYTFNPGEFPYDYLHLAGSDESTSPDFIGATGVLGYPSLSVDTTKIPTAWVGKLKYVDTTIPRDAESILTFNSFSGDTAFHNKPCGVRYLGGPYQIVFFGFPLYFMKEDEARSVAQKVLMDLGEGPGVEEKAGIKDQRLEISLKKSWPNPFKTVTNIQFSVAGFEHISLKVYNLAGQLVKNLLDEPKGAGLYNVVWDGKDKTGREVASGLYFYRLEAGSFADTKRVVLLK